LVPVAALLTPHFIIFCSFYFIIVIKSFYNNINNLKKFNYRPIFLQKKNIPNYEFTTKIISSRGVSQYILVKLKENIIRYVV